MIRDEVFQQYEEAMEKLDREYNEARAKARAIFREQLKTLQLQHHKELKAIRALEQKTKGR